MKKTTKKLALSRNNIRNLNAATGGACGLYSSEYTEGPAGVCMNTDEVDCTLAAQSLEGPSLCC